MEPRPRRAVGVGLLGAALLSSPGAIIHGTGQPSNFARAVAPRTFEFPTDHGSHPEFATEWWYLTGHLRDGKGDLFGFQATWFRRALAPSQPRRASGLATRDVILFHSGLTDLERSRFTSDTGLSRAASNWAGARPDALHVWLLDQRLEARAEGSWEASFDVGVARLELALLPTRPPLLHGSQPGLSIKGPLPGQASYYYSQTRLRVTGTLRRSPNEPVLAVHGQAWFDHETFSDQLPDEYEGWDWFSVALDDGTDLMAFQLRQRDGGVAPTSAATLRDADGSRLHLAREEFSVSVTETWPSPAAGPEDRPYPAAWRLQVPAATLELTVRPVLADQEHRGSSPGSMAYWEGLCRFEGERDGETVQGLGYVELVGYRGAGPARL